MTDAQQKMYDVLATTTDIALATTVDNIPNVRIVNFCYDPARPGILYFASDRDNHKVMEFAKNTRVAFTTIPHDGASITHVRSNDVMVRKSPHSIEDIQHLFIDKVEGYDETIQLMGHTLDVYELVINTAFVVSDFDNTEVISFGTNAAFSLN